MKKHLIAAAVAGAFAVPAMAQVTVGGILELAPYHTGKVTTQAASATVANTLKNTRTAGASTWATSVLNVSGSEDLGGGLTASFLLMTGAGTMPNSNTNAPDSGIGNRERSLSLTKSGLGTLRYGRFVAAPGPGFHAYTNAGSASLPGSMYGVSQGHSATAGGDFGHNNFHSNAGNFERQNNLLQLTSVPINGFTVTVALGRDALDNSAANRGGQAKAEYSGLQLVYAAGPLSIGLGGNQRKTEVEAAPATPADAAEDPIVVGVAAVPQSSTKGSLNWVGGSYNLGVATIAGAYVAREDKATTAAGVTTTANDISIAGVGVSVPLGAVTLRANAYSGKDDRGIAATDDMKLQGHQLSAVYALSKRTSLIVATGVNEYKRDGAASTQATRKYEASTLSVMHSF